MIGFLNAIGIAMTENIKTSLQITQKLKISDTELSEERVDAADTQIKAQGATPRKVDMKKRGSGILRKGDETDTTPPGTKGINRIDIINSSM